MTTFTDPPDIEMFKFATPNQAASNTGTSNASTTLPHDPDRSTSLALINLFTTLAGNGLGAHVQMPKSSNLVENSHLASPLATRAPIFASDLNDFLNYATSECGTLCEQYHAALQNEKIGPDVISTLPDLKELTDLGIPKGDAHRLKHAANDWWADTSRQRKRLCRSPTPVCCALQIPMNLS
jgi:hypothetical protein